MFFVSFVKVIYYVSLLCCSVGFPTMTANGTQLNFSLGLKLFLTEILLTMIQCFLAICKAQINFFRGSDRFCKCRSRMPKLNLTAVTGSCRYTVYTLLACLPTKSLSSCQKSNDKNENSNEQVCLRICKINRYTESRISFQKKESLVIFVKVEDAPKPIVWVVTPLIILFFLGIHICQVLLCGCFFLFGVSNGNYQ